MRVVRQTDRQTQQSYKRSECFQKRILGVKVISTVYDLAQIERVKGRVAGPSGRVV
jgi:hypothetical protein